VLDIIEVTGGVTEVEGIVSIVVINEPPTWVALSVYEGVAVKVCLETEIAEDDDSSFVLLKIWRPRSCSVSPGPTSQSHSPLPLDTHR
jgi:hypothetical protein